MDPIDSIQPLAITATANGASLGQGLMLMGLGMGVVFGALILIWIMLVLLRKFENGPGREASPAPAGSPATTPVPPKSGEELDPRTVALLTAAAIKASRGIDPRTVAILTAAAIAVVKAPVRVKNIRFITQQTSPAWARHGRSAIHSSHRLRKGKS